ncbi:hypothetical protein [Brevibacillus laterosporus]|uniref:hypothetical protein n=1 Tax=Brevibacillus laterosporus TaxID=1465 RepID=UPI00265D0624|nr:hypothetical protein [Brevibacillus laterosporus]
MSLINKWKMNAGLSGLELEADKHAEEYLGIELLITLRNAIRRNLNDSVSKERKRGA